MRMTGTDQEITSRLADELTEFLAGQLQAEHEFDFYLANNPASFDGSSTSEPLPTLTEILPPPTLHQLKLDTVVEGKLRKGVELVRIVRYVIERISRLYSDSELRPDYWVIVSRGTVVTPALARDRQVPRFRLIGTPVLAEMGWTVTLTEEK